MSSLSADFAAEARERLCTLTARADADFRSGQLEAIRDVVTDRARVLCVQRTGWGKSAVYFVATALLRASGAGPTLIISPLLALMRNQIAAAGRLGLKAHTVNSTNRDEWDLIERQLTANTIDLLLISPERLNNPVFREGMLPRFAHATGLLVIDEAHCISDWGHDFRPDYRRVRDALAGLAPAAAVLATTATANDRVVEDVVEQLGGDVEPVRIYRGALARSSLRLEVVNLPSPSDRLAWLVEHLPKLPGSGIVYALTKRDADQVAAFLTARGVSAISYTGEQDSHERVETERRLQDNDVKAVVATSALGMGYDKPDLTFVVHYQAPGSVIAYYQQVGRAGRAVGHADIVLLRGQEDRRIQDFFIEQAFPTRERTAEVLDELVRAGETGRTTRELMAVVNLGMSRIESMLKILDVEGAVLRDGTRWKRIDGSAWTYDSDRYEQVTALRRAEQKAMTAFGADGRCLMRALQEELDDPDARDCGRCSVCTAPRFADPPEPALVEQAWRHLRSRPIELEVKKVAPDALTGAMRKIPDDLRTEPGLALARLGDGGWWPAVQRSLDARHFDPELVDALAELTAPLGPSWLTCVPSTTLGHHLAGFARGVAGALGIPCVEMVARREPRAPQREMANAVQQVANVRGAFTITTRPPGGTGLLLDDRRQSGWTLAMVGGQLRQAGVDRVVPAVLATAG